MQVPVLFGLDSMHGANYVSEAVLYPHALALAASFDPVHTHRMARATAAQTRAAGVPWVFGPVLDVGTAPRFPRIYETFGEDPWLVATMVRDGRGRGDECWA